MINHFISTDGTLFAEWSPVYSISGFVAAIQVGASIVEIIDLGSISNFEYTNDLDYPTVTLHVTGYNFNGSVYSSEQKDISFATLAISGVVISKFTNHAIVRAYSNYPINMLYLYEGSEPYPIAYTGGKTIISSATFINLTTAIGFSTSGLYSTGVEIKFSNYAIPSTLIAGGLPNYNDQYSILVKHSGPGTIGVINTNFVSTSNRPIYNSGTYTSGISIQSAAGILASSFFAVLNINRKSGFVGKPLMVYADGDSGREYVGITFGNCITHKKKIGNSSGYTYVAIVPKFNRM